MNILRQLFLLLALGLCLITGCAKRTGLYPVTVEVLAKGAPIDSVSVTFIEENGSYAVGLTDSRGIAKMYMRKPGDGVKPGHYKITLSKFAAPPVADKPLDPAKDAQPTPVFVPKSLIPIKYSEIEKSGLEIDVAPPGVSLFSITLD